MSVKLHRCDCHDFEALSFDCYGTLIDWESGIGAVLAPWAARAAHRSVSERLLERYADCGGPPGGADTPVRSTRHPRAAMHSSAKALGVAVSAEDCERFAARSQTGRRFRIRQARWRCSRRATSSIILSNIDRASFAASNARLDVRFDAIITAQDIGSYKPSPRNFEALLETARRNWASTHGRLMHVAQSLFHDHVPAKASGLPTVWIDRRAGRADGGRRPRRNRGGAGLDVSVDGRFPRPLLRWRD